MCSDLPPPHLPAARSSASDALRCEPGRQGYRAETPNAVIAAATGPNAGHIPHRLHSTYIVKTTKLLVACVLLGATLQGCAAGQPSELRPADSVAPKLPPAASAIATATVEAVRELRFSAPTAARVYAYVMVAAATAYFDVAEDREAAAVLAASHMMAAFSRKEFVAARFDVLLRAYGASTQVVHPSVAALLDQELNEGYAESVEIGADLQTGEWAWRPTGLQRTPFQHPGFGGLPTFSSASECDIPPPDLARAEREGKLMLTDLDLERTVSKEVIAWLGGAGSPTPSGLWLLLASSIASREKSDTATTTRLLAGVAVAGYDAGVLAWREKREHNLARPETMWKTWRGEEVILPRETPPHPSYPSGHSTFSGAAAVVIEGFYGDTPLLLSLQEEVGLPAERYEYASISEAVRAVNKSRVDAGFHYPLDVEFGESLGRCAGERALSEIDILIGIEKQ